MCSMENCQIIGNIISVFDSMRTVGNSDTIGIMSNHSFDNLCQQ